MKSRWMEHNGKRVFIADFSHFGDDSTSLKKEANEVIKILSKEPPDSTLVISNIDWTTATLNNIKVLMDILPITNQFVRKRCAIGTTGMSWRFVETLNQATGKAKLSQFQTLEEALDWIVED